MVTIFFVSVIATILLTPGPTNTLLASSGIQAGIKKSIRLVPSEVFGYLISITLWGILLQSVSQYLPWLPSVLKLLSASYIIFLALKLWKTSTQKVSLDQSTITAKALFCATLLNPKALLFASTVFPQTAWSNLSIYLVHMSVFLLLITPIAFLWIVFGSALISNKIKWLNQCNLQRTASLILISFSIPLSYSAILKL